MKMSNLIRLLTDYIIQYGDRDVVTAQYNKNDETEYTYGNIGVIVDYEDGFVGLVGDKLEDFDK